VQLGDEKALRIAHALSLTHAASRSRPGRARSADPLIEQRVGADRGAHLRQRLVARRSRLVRA